MVGGAGAASASASPIAAAPAPTPAPSTAPAAPAPAPSTDPGGSSPTPPPTEPAAPVILSPAGGAQLAGAVTVSGTGEPGSSVQVLAGGSSEPLCIVTPGGSGDWSCATTGLASSASTVIRAVQLVSGSPQQEASVTVRVLNAPVVTGGPRGTLTNAVVQGTAFAGATVTATAGSFVCSGTADASGAWSCPLGGGITDGDYLVSATQSTSWSSGASPASDAVAIRVDVTVPAAPVLLSPRSGTTLPTSGSTFSGTGEDGATVSVFAGAYTICQVTVSNSSWSCVAAAVPAGGYSLAVLQQDAAGNVSVQSGPLTMLFQDASATAPATPSGPTAPAGTTAPTSPSAGSDPAAPGPPATGDGSTPGSGAEPSSPSAPSTPGGAAPPAAGGSPVTPGSWSDATRFTAALQPAFGTGAGALWWLALVLGAVALVGIALPARLLAGTVRELAPRETPSGGARAGLLASLLGRNRSRHEYDEAPEIHISPAVTTVAVVLASAALVTLSGPVESQPAYLRLFLAVAAGLAIVNAVATVVPAAVAKVTLGVVAAPRIRPALLLLSAALAVFSRLADLDPVLVFGLVAGLVVAETAARSARGTLATVQVLCLLALGAVAWLVSGALGVDPASGDVWGAALAELLHVVVLASFGASSALLLPVGRSPGRSLLEWSPATWTLLTIASFTALAMLFVPTLTAGTGGALLALGIATAAFAAVSVSAWVWQRYLADDEERAR